MTDIVERLDDTITRIDEGILKDLFKKITGRPVQLTDDDEMELLAALMRERKGWEKSVKHFGAF